MGASLEGGAAYCHGDDDDSKTGHEGIAGISRDLDLGGRRVELVEEGEEDIAHETREAGEGATEAGGKAYVQRDCLLDLGVLGRSVVRLAVGGERERGSPSLAEETEVVGEEAHDEGACKIGPEDGEGGRRGGVEGQPLEAQTCQGAQDGEQHEVGDGVQLGGSRGRAMAMAGGGWQKAEGAWLAGVRYGRGRGCVLVGEGGFGFGGQRRGQRRALVVVVGCMLGAVVVGHAGARLGAVQLGTCSYLVLSARLSTHDWRASKR